MPVTTPVVPIVATAVLLLAQLPPVVLSDRVVVEPLQIAVVPVIAGTEQEVVVPATRYLNTKQLFELIGVLSTHRKRLLPISCRWGRKVPVSVSWSLSSKVKFLSNTAMSTWSCTPAFCPE